MHVYPFRYACTCVQMLMKDLLSLIMYTSTYVQTHVQEYMYVLYARMSRVYTNSHRVERQKCTMSHAPTTPTILVGTHKQVDIPLTGMPRPHTHEYFTCGYKLRMTSHPSSPVTLYSNCRLTSIPSRVDPTGFTQECTK